LIDRFNSAPWRRLPGLWLPVVLWAAMIFAFSAQSHISVSADSLVDFVTRKTAHMFVFGVLAILLWRALVAVRGARVAAVWAWLLAVAYAASDEFHQSFISGRSALATDVVFDAVGALVALFLLAEAWRLRSVRQRRG
jgi:VanZ family protein